MNKIIIFLPDLCVGGAQRNTINLANKLCKKYKVRIVVINKISTTFHIDKNIEIRNLNKKRLLGSFYSIIKEIKNFKSEIIYSTLGYINLYIIFVSFFLKNKPKIIIREANIISKNLENLDVLKKILYKLLYINIYSFADYIICSSSLMKKDMVKLIGKKIEHKLIIINNFVDSNFIRKNLVKKIENENNKITLIAAGRLNIQKGYDLLINHFINFKYYNIKLFIYGEGSEYEKLDGLIKKNKLDFIKLRQFDKNIWNHIYNSDYFVISSRWEGMPNIVLESLACGTRILNFSNIEQINEIYDESNENIIKLDLNSRVDFSKINKKYIKKNLLPSKYELTKNLDNFEHLIEKKL